MIQMITDMMSNPNIQESIISLLENHLKKMDVRMATHLVLMGMKVFFSINLILSPFMLH